MVFSNIEFLFVFLPIVLLCYYIAPRFLKNAVLTAFSLVFYAWDRPAYTILMIISIVFNFLFGLLISHRAKLDEAYNKSISDKTKEKHTTRVILVISVVFNLFYLGVFKYTGFIVNTINDLFHTDIDKIVIGTADKNIDLLKVALPIGISFYTFQAMSYVIDVYRKNVNVNKNIVSFSTYISMFPQLIAGPIVRYKTVDKEIRSRKETVDMASEGIFRFSIGLGKKVLIANNVGALWDSIRVMERSELSTFTAWLGVFAFTLQIYFDFSGYSDMAIGLGKLFGFNFSENFEHPYESRSITEFWRRWHISLSTWFKEYVYIPLGGNRKGKGRQILNIAIVWLLTGLWHGASWNFVLWGVYYAILLLIEKLGFLKVLEKLPKLISWIYTFVLVVIGWAIFSFSDVKYGSDFVKSLCFNAGKGLVSRDAAFMVMSNIILLLIGLIGSFSLIKKLCIKVFGKSESAAWIGRVLFVITCLFLCSAYMVSSTYNPFLYFRF